MNAQQQQYRNATHRMLDQIETESASIHQAAELLAAAVMKDELIHVIGTGGHSNVGAYELFCRAGGLAAVNAILDPGTLVSMGARRSTIIERTPGYAGAVLDAFDVHSGVLIVVNAYGINAVTIDAALEGKKRGLPTIGITTTSFADSIPADHPARHPSGKNLYQIVDVYVNCHMPLGDAVVEFEGLKQKVGPLSTIALAYTLNLITIETVGLLLDKKRDPMIWTSANLVGGDELNKRLFDKYKGRIRLL